MAPDPSVESPDGKRRLSVKSLMVMVAVVAIGFGVLAQTARTSREHDAYQARFNAWIAEVEKANPMLQRSAMTTKTTTTLFETSRTCTYNYQTRARKPITIQVSIRTGPFSSVRQVTIDSPGHSISRPFEILEANPGFDLKAEFPETFR